MSVTQLTETAPDQTATVEVTQGDGTWLVSQAAVLCHMFASSFSHRKAKALTMWLQQSFTPLLPHHCTISKT